ncbi:MULTISPECIES: Hcp family type VI secretion system effector [Photorhabdus]|uniref:Type VI secretion system tube protein Hcp n=2 Tax=Photorhabdus khanii TaxID=1004150 RepID=A0A4R4K562_9GAMM|nr:Hcp family type VI secretion system effector [Photorhabdus khanii]MQL48473.1 type VI secretion system tube protein Hcp [Photorhabdus khanii]TDB62568.1 type VI secretion system tube protein Hcp [Photorhabdus khanii subsp. guanajuatensis]
MSDLIYLTLRGRKQGLISAGCSSIDSIGNKGHLDHIDKIFVYNLTHSLTRDQNVNHHPITFKKPVDKSSPLLGVAISDNEILDAFFDICRTNQSGIQELYYTIKVIDATITDLAVYHPHSITHAGSQSQETISLRYKSITWTHHIAGTSAYSIWDDRIY